jgi:hypothetical protein
MGTCICLPAAHAATQLHIHRSVSGRDFSRAELPPILLKNKVRGEAALKSPPQNPIHNPANFPATIAGDCYTETDISGLIALCGLEPRA